MSPRFNFYINRCFVQPVSDPAVVKAMLNHQIHARYVTMGSPTSGITWPKQDYSGIDPLPVEVGSYPTVVPPDTPSNKLSVARAMAVAGYMGADQANKAVTAGWGARVGGVT